MWGMGGDSFGDLTSILSRSSTQLVDVLESRSFRACFEQAHTPLLQYLFMHLNEVVDMALNMKGSYDKVLQANALLCLSTQVSKFTTQLTTWRPFLQKLNACISSDEDLANDVTTRFCRILAFIIQSSNGFVLIHFPDKNNLIMKLLRYIDRIAMYSLMQFLTWSGLEIMNDFLGKVDTTVTLLKRLGDNPVINERVLSILANCVCIPRGKSKLTDPFLEDEVVVNLIQMCLDTEHECVSVSALRLLTCLSNHFYEIGSDLGLARQMGFHVKHFCEFISHGEKFTKSRSLALFILIRVVPFTRDAEMGVVFDLLPHLLDRVIKEPHHTNVHAAFYELLKMTVTRRPEIVHELNLKQVIMDLYAKRDEVMAVYWGFLHRITGIIARWKGFEKFPCKGWSEFVATVYDPAERVYMAQYGETPVCSEPLETMDGKGNMPRMSLGKPETRRIISKPQFTSVHITAPPIVRKKPIESTAYDAGEEDDYECDYSDDQEDQTEKCGDVLQWMLTRLVSKPRITTPLSLTMGEVFVANTATKIVELSRCGGMLAMSSGRDVEVFRIDRRQALLVQWAMNSRITSVRFSPDGDYVMVMARNEACIHQVSTATGNLLKSTPFRVVGSATIDQDCSKIVCNDDTTTTVYSFPSLESICEFDYENCAGLFSCFSADGLFVGTAYADGYVQVYSIEKKEIIFHVKAHDSEVTAMIVCNGGTRIVTGSSDALVKVWTVSPTEPKWRTFTAHQQGITSLAVDKSQKWLVSGSRDMYFNLSNLDKEEMVYAISAHTGTVCAVSFAYDKPLLAVASDDLLVKTWTVEESV